MISDKNIIKTFIFLLSISFMSACAPSTNIVASWDNPDATEKVYNNIIVTALVDDITAKQNLEAELVGELEKEGTQAAKSLDIFPPELKEERRTEDELLEALEENQFDAVVTVALIEKESEAQYVPGNYPYSPLNAYSYYGTFWGYYNYWYPQMYNTGYYDIDKTYFLETNLYDASSEELIWSAQSKTVNPVSLETFTEDYSERIIETMENAGLIGGDKS